MFYFPDVRGPNIFWVFDGSEHAPFYPRIFSPGRHSELIYGPPHGGTGHLLAFASESFMSSIFSSIGVASSACRSALPRVLTASVLRITGGRKADDRLKRVGTRSNEDEQAGQERPS